MLFNSYVFIFLFLPVALAGFHLIGRREKKESALAWLVAASLFFYGWWNPIYLTLIIASMIGNFILGVQLGHKRSRLLLVTGLIMNLALLGYFKYANFFVDNLNLALGTSYHFERIILPLAISFYTFQQIAYLVDAYKGLTHEYSFLHYCLFVTFFPQLIAGPIIHHKDILPQFDNSRIYRLSSRHLAVGLTIFILGLFKKVVLADSIAVYATPVFQAAEQGITLTFFEAWCGALAYTFQLYFDFSGYSDMAIGIARMFGIILPLNFFSPYKANNIIEFWRRWHMTLSRFLRDYLYIPLGGNRKGKMRRYANLMITMLLGGLWHGANWTFVAWGAMHGLYLCINHGWNAFAVRHFPATYTIWKITRATGWAITFLAVVIAWVMFRAESFAGALSIYQSMFLLNGLSLPADFTTSSGILETLSHFAGASNDGMFFNNIINKPHRGYQLILIMTLIVLVLPNVAQFLQQEQSALDTDNFTDGRKPLLTWKPVISYALLLILLAFWSIDSIQSGSEFLYFNF